MYYITKPTHRHETVNVKGYVDYVFEDYDRAPVKICKQFMTTKHFELPYTSPYNTTTLDSLNQRIENFLVTHPDTENWYHTFHIPKHSGGYRKITAPHTELKALQQQLVTTLTYIPTTKTPFVYPHNAAYAYQRGRSTVDALKVHQANRSRWFLKLDIKDFFPSCTVEFIRKTVQQLYPWCCIPEHIWEQIINVITYNGGLPQGAPTSPFISNMLMLPFDHALTQVLSKKVNGQIFRYTRYADDLLISSRYDFDKDQLIAIVEEQLQEHTPLIINKSKIRYGSYAGRNWNLGLMFNKDNNITVGHKRKSNIKKTLHNLFNNWQDWSVQDVQVLVGQLAYITNVEPEYIKNLIQNFEGKYRINYNQFIKSLLNLETPEQLPYIKN